MQRLTLVAGSAVALVTAILLFRPAEDHPQALAKRHIERPPADAAAVDPSVEGDLRSSKRHAAPLPETSSRFTKLARQIAAMPQDTERENAIRDLAQEWAKDAPAAAEEWAQVLEDPAERERALTHVCLETAALDPRAAVGIAQQHGLHEGTIEAIAARWAGVDFAAASSWVDELPQGEVRDRMLMRLVQSHAGNSPAEAAAMLSESALSGTMQDEAAMTVLHQWLLKDPEAARQWVELFPAGPLKDRAAGAVQNMSAHR